MCRGESKSGSVSENGWSCRRRFGLWVLDVEVEQDGSWKTYHCGNFGTTCLPCPPNLHRSKYPVCMLSSIEPESSVWCCQFSSIGFMGWDLWQTQFQRSSIMACDASTLLRFYPALVRYLLEQGEGWCTTEIYSPCEQHGLEWNSHEFAKVKSEEATVTQIESHWTQTTLIRYWIKDLGLWK